MVLMKWSIVIFPFILSLCSACNGQYRAETRIVDSISRDIPLDKQGFPIKSYLFKNKIVNQVNLELLENGFDSLQIRIWHSSPYIDSVYLLVVKNINGEWFASISNYKIIFDKNRNIIDTIIGRSTKVTPKSGWQFFLDRIFKLKITELPDINAVIESLAIMDDGGVAVEVSTRLRYRFYHYLTSTLCDERIIQAREMESIMQLVKSELDFLYPRCP